MKSLRQALGIAVRLGLAVAVMAWLLHKMGLQQLADTLRGLAGEWPTVLAALLLTGAPLLLCAARWKWILAAQGMPLSWARIVRIFLIGQFFNAFMIGPTGGDLVKAYYAARETNHRKTEAVTSVFIDRVVGLLVLAMLVGTVIAVRWTFYAAHDFPRRAAMASFAACIVLVVGALAAFSVHWFEVWPALRRWQARPLVGGLLATAERAYNAFYVLRRQPRLLLAIAATSLVVQLAFVVTSAMIGHALHLPLAFKDYLAVSPLVGLISAIPITPGGVGIREGTNIKMLAIFGVTAGQGLVHGFMPYLFLVLWGLPGGVLFLFHRPPPGTSIAGDMQAGDGHPAPGA